MGVLSGYSYRQKITIDHTKIAADLTDFPVKVILNDSNFDFSKANSDGSDIRFTAADGETLLPYERELHSFVPSSTNIAAGKTVTFGPNTSEGKWGYSDLSVVTDGNTSSDEYFEPSRIDSSAPNYVEVDLGDVFLINQIKHWHYYEDGRKYNEVKVLVSENGTDWETVFDSTVDGKYQETSSGHIVEFSPRRVRYIRDSINGNELNPGCHFVEIQAFEASGSAVYHVKVPAVSDDDDTEIYLYCGNPTALDGENKTAVWDSNFVLVNHMGPDLTDSTSNGNDGTNHGTTAGIDESGHYRSFDGSNDYIGNMESLPSLSSWTAEIDVTPLRVSGSNALIGGRTSSTGYFSALQITDGDLLSYNNVTGGFSTTASPTVPISSNQKYILAAKGESTPRASVYVEGNLAESVTNGGTTYSPIEWVFGRGYDGRYPLAYIHEVRISNIARSDAWIAATSETLKGTLLTFSFIEPINQGPTVLSGYLYRKEINIDHTKVAADLADFPLRVKLTADNFPFDKAKADGTDIRFTSDDGVTTLAYERELHDQTNQRGIYHVKIPLLSSTEDTKIYLYYGNDVALDGENKTAVWDEDFVMVQHMGDLTDSTANGNDGTNYGTTLGTNEDGHYRSFGGDDKVVVPNVYNTAELTVMVQAAITGDDSWVINKRDNSGDDQWQLIHYQGSMGAGIYSGSSWVGSASDGNVVGIGKRCFCFTTTGVNGGPTRLFSNGVQIASNTLTGNMKVGAREVVIGEAGWGDHFLKGSIAEIRISNTTRSDAWIAATSTTLSDDALNAFGFEEALESSGGTGSAQRVWVVFI